MGFQDSSTFLMLITFGAPSCIGFRDIVWKKATYERRCINPTAPATAVGVGK